MLKVVAIIGHLNSGKNTFAKTFTDNHQFIPMAFADPIKIIIQDLFKISTEELWGSSDKRSPLARELLQVFGTDFARKYSPDIWVNKMDDRLQYFDIHGIDRCFTIPDRYPSTIKNIIITDLRFPNEAQMLREKYDATLIEIVRPNSGNNSYSEHCRHISETAIANIPKTWIKYVVANTGTLDDLSNNAQHILELICSQ